MKVYLAASWKLREDMREVRDQLAAMGHEVTSRWIDITDSWSMKHEDIVREPRRAEDEAMHDVKDIVAADLVAVFTSVPSTTGGLHFEYGLAYGLGKRITIVGPMPGVFFALPGARRFQGRAGFLNWMLDGGK